MAMTATSMGFVRLFSGVGRLAGALSGKELRVASRRARSYALRSGYIVLLSVILASAWYSIVGASRGGGTAFDLSRASVVSTHVATGVLWFQLVAAQIIAAVMISFSLTEEMRRGTLSLLMTTPITSVQIVLGKLLGGLLQVLLLLAISLPALAVLRVQGGLSWDFVLAGFSITLSATLFAGALSLLLSTRYRHAYGVVPAGVVVYLAAFLILPFGAWVLASLRPVKWSWPQSVLDLINPFYALFRVTTQTLAGGPVATGSFPWPLHCLILSALAAVLLGVSMTRIRRVVLGGLSAGTEVFRLVERPAQSPITWKDNPGPIWRLRWADKTIVIGALMISCSIAAASELGLRDEAVSLFYLERVFWLAAILRLAVLAATGITREKENGAWAVLLTTPLDDMQILHAKAMAALRRDSALLFSAFAIQIGWLIGATDTSEIASTLLFMLSRVVSVFLAMTVGLYYGVHLKATVAAAGAAVGTYLCLVYLVGGQLLPLLLRAPWLPGRGFSGSRMAADSVVPAGVIVLSISLGALFFERTRRDLRRYIF